MPKGIVHPNLDDVHFFRRQRVHVFGDFRGVFQVVGDRRHAAHAALQREAPAGCEDSRVTWTPRALLIADLKDQVLIRSQTEHGGHAVGGIGAQILFDVFARVEFRVLREIHGIADMAVDIDYARHDDFAGQIDHLSAFGHRQSLCGADSGNPSVIDNHGHLSDGRIAGTVDQCEVLQNFDLGAGR